MSKIDLHNYEAYLLDYLEGNLSQDLCAELKLFAMAHPELEIDFEDLDLPVFKAEKINADFKLELKKTELDFPDSELLNYLENELSEADKKSFETKLSEDKDLAADLKQYKKTKLVPELSGQDFDRSAFYKSEDQFYLNNKTVAYFEHQLSGDERSGFESELMENEALQQELKIVERTRLSPDFHVVFPDKNALKKEARVIALFSFRTITGVAAAVMLLFTLGFIINYYTSHQEDKRSYAKKEQPLPANKPLTDPQTTLNVDAQAHNTSAEQNVASNRAPRLHKNSFKVIREKQAEPVNHPEAETEKNRESEQKKNEQEIKPLQQELIAENITKSSGAVTTEPAFMAAEEKAVALTVLPELDEDLEGEDADKSKNGFWQKAVKLAKRANSLGLKSIHGDEKPREGFALSFNAFKVERH